MARRGVGRSLGGMPPAFASAGTTLTAVVAALLCSWVACSCGPAQTPPPASPRATRPMSSTMITASVAGRTEEVVLGARWAYMLQGDVTTEIAETSFEVLVMDYTKDGTEDASQLYTPAEMALMKSDGAARTLLAYLSVGEAEEYRYYFDPSWADDAARGFRDPDAPDWLGALNPDWPGDYKVRYWDGEWQEIVLGYVERLIAWGYDGVYLDIVDGFEYWSDPENGEGYRLGEADAAERMITFVTRIATLARGLRGDFLVIPQNGERLLRFDTSGLYLDSVDGLAVEDLFYDERTPIDESVTAERMIYLDKVLAAGKPVFVVDYTYAGASDSVVKDFRARAAAAGYSAYAAWTDRQLDSLVTFAGQGE